MSESGFWRIPGGSALYYQHGLLTVAPPAGYQIKDQLRRMLGFRFPLLQKGGRYHVACSSSPCVSDIQRQTPPEAGLYEGLASLASTWRRGGLSNGQFIASYIHVIMT